MHRRLFFFTVLLHFAITNQAQEKRFSFSRPKMGSPFTIIFYDNDSLHAINTANNCFSLVDSFVNIYSDYIVTSELNQLSNSAGKNNYVHVTPSLYDIIIQSQKAFLLSNGAFDITIGPIIKLWRKARSEQHFPGRSTIEEKRKLVGFNQVKIDTVSKSVLLVKQGMQLDLGGIAQGYIAQKVLERLMQHSIKRALVDVSGDIAMGEPPPGKRGWTIGINLPERTEELQKKKLLLHNCTVSTSGDVYQYIEHNGKKYSHIVDPRTGYGVTSQRNVTVIAGDGTTADWLATACSILSIHKAKRLARKMKAEVMIAQIKNGQLVLYATKNFKKYFVGG
ncbi:MAG: FAD:protein FMN transferase [Segetibacter sp.]|nr:FAD:protein FMN transferase [Segetibacter sp.]